MLTTAQIRLIRSTFAQTAPFASELMPAFCGTLARTNDRMRRMVESGAFDGIGDWLSGVTVLVYNLHQPRLAARLALDLIAPLAALELSRDDLDGILHALLRTLARHLRGQYTAEVEAAWGALFEAVVLRNLCLARQVAC